MKKEKKIPLRNCAACSARRPKKELLRIVRTPDGQVLPDESGRTNGRGVYLCPSAACLERARKTKALSRSLGCAVTEEVFQMIDREIKRVEE